MAISDKLNYLIETKQLFKDRLNSLGAEITSSTTFRNYLTWLDTFYGEVSDKTDLSQNGVVGKTSQESTTGANLMPVENVTKTTGGIEVTNNGDGTLTLNGTATAQVVYPITNTGNNTARRVPVTENDYKFMLYGDTNVSNDTYFLQVLFGTETETTKFFEATDNGATSLHIKTDRRIGYALIIRNGQSFNNHIIKPMGVLSTYTGGFEPYTGNQASPNPDYPQPINNLSGNVPYKVSGKNKLNSSNIVTGTRNGITTSYNPATQEITFNGTCTYDNTQILVSTDNIPFIRNTTKMIAYYVDGTISGNGLFRTFRGNGEWDLYSGVSISTLNSSNPIVQVTGSNTDVKARTDFRFDNGTILTNFKIKLMITDSEDTTYEPYISQTFDIPLKSKNLFDGLTTKGSYNTVTGEVGTTIYNMWRNTNPIGVNPNNDYVFSLSGTVLSVPFRVFYYDINKMFISTETTTNGKFITPADCYYVNWHSTALYTNYPNGLTNAMIEKGSTTPTDYEPYYDIELCKIDTYEDKIYSSDGRFYLEKKIGKVVLDGSNDENWSVGIQSGYTRATIIINDIYAYTDAGRHNDKILCSNFYPNITDSVGIIYQYQKTILFYPSLDITTKEQWRTWLSSNNTTLYYVLNTPTTTEITEENYPSLYNALKQIQDYLTAYKINKEFILGYSSPEIEY